MHLKSFLKEAIYFTIMKYWMQKNVQAHVSAQLRQHSQHLSQQQQLNSLNLSPWKRTLKWNEKYELANKIWGRNNIRNNRYKAFYGNRFTEGKLQKCLTNLVYSSFRRKNSNVTVESCTASSRHIKSWNEIMLTIYPFSITINVGERLLYEEYMRGFHGCIKPLKNI